MGGHEVVCAVTKLYAQHKWMVAPVRHVLADEYRGSADSELINLKAKNLPVAAAQCRRRSPSSGRSTRRVQILGKDTICEPLGRSPVKLDAIVIGVIPSVTLPRQEWREVRVLW